MKSNCPPVLFCIFNRPDLTEKSFEQIREARPSKLFVSADGPRDGRVAEADLCAASRSIIRKVDWPCQIHTLFRSNNLGCQMAMSSGIDWFFEHVESGVILEDDCVAHGDFFVFCQQLLERYEFDSRVMCITGNNFQNGLCRGTASYYFSVFPHCWGWATWRRAWGLYDSEMKSLPLIIESGLLDGLVGENQIAWIDAFERVRKGEMDSWAYRWLLSCWSQSGLTATPNRNLVTNIGFDARATHTVGHSPLSSLPSEDLGEITHPLFVYRHYFADDLILNNIYNNKPIPGSVSLRSRITHKLRSSLCNVMAFVGSFKTAP